jgi:hypothetical protein
MKMNDCNQLLDMQWKTLKVCKLLKKTRYQRAIYINMQILRHHQLNDSFLWKMIQEHVTSFNEESGELSFSVLARCVIGDTVKSNHEHLSKIYSLLPIYKAINKDMRDDIKAPLIQRTLVGIKPNCPEIQATTAYFQSKIRELKMNYFMVYDGNKKSYKKRFRTMVRVTSNAAKSFWSEEPTIITDLGEWGSENICTNFLAEFHDLWPKPEVFESPIQPEDIILGTPEVKQRDPRPESSDSDAQGEDDDDDDDGPDPPPPIERVRDRNYRLFGTDSDESSAGAEDEGGDSDDSKLIVEADDNKDAGVHTPPRIVSSSYQDQFLREVERVSPRKRARTPASSSSLYPFVSH